MEVPVPPGSDHRVHFVAHSSTGGSQKFKMAEIVSQPSDLQIT